MPQFSFFSNMGFQTKKEMLFSKSNKQLSLLSSQRSSGLQGFEVLLKLLVNSQPSLTFHKTEKLLPWIPLDYSLQVSIWLP